MRPLTYDIPKPMAPVNGRPFLEYLLEMLRENGISEVVLLLGYLPEKIVQHFGDGSNFGVNIKYSIGSISDKTGTRVKNAEHLLDPVFLLMYGDNYWPLNLKRLLAFYNEHGTLASTTVYANKDGKGEYGAENNIHVDDDGYVLKYDKGRKDKNLNGVDIGFFILSKEVLELAPNRDFSFEEEVLPALVDKRQLSGYRIEHRYYYISTPESLKLTERYLKPKKVVLVDRDGVINGKPPEHGYVKNWSEFEFLPGAIEALRLLTQNGYNIYVITNQRGIARGMMSEPDLDIIHQKLKAELEKHHAKINGIYYCPHGRDDGCDCRKPKPGMLFQAASEHDFDLTKAVLIGDNESDLQAGDAAGCKTVPVEPGKDLLQIVTSLLNS
ncbi:MAG: HAD-IIIA family hydrolase [Chloroflexi bacterium]|nr:HAD-IIIA family hydrolase [Chloroflexota bacterium]